LFSRCNLSIAVSISAELFGLMPVSNERPGPPFD